MREAISSAASATLDSLVTSREMGIIRPRSSMQSSLKASTAPISLPAAKTVAPASQSSRTMARPRCPLPPVTRQLYPDRSNIVLFLNPQDQDQLLGSTNEAATCPAINCPMRDISSGVNGTEALKFRKVSAICCGVSAPTITSSIHGNDLTQERQRSTGSFLPKSSASCLRHNSSWVPSNTSFFIDCGQFSKGVTSNPWRNTLLTMTCTFSSRSTNSGASQR